MVTTKSLKSNVINERISYRDIDLISSASFFSHKTRFKITFWQYVTGNTLRIWKSFTYLYLCIHLFFVFSFAI